MNEKINGDLKSVKFIFNRNKSFIPPAVIILISVVLFFQFVIPQFGSLLAAKEEAKSASSKLDILKSNFNMLSNIDEVVLDSQLKTLSLALPLTKDFNGIFNSIYFSAQKAGVGLGEFSIQIGDLSGSEKKEKFPNINLSIPVNAGVSGVNIFAETLNNTFPLSEISVIKVGERSSTVTLSFYYKPLDGSSKSGDVPIKPLSQKGLLLISELKKFIDISNSSLSPPVSTSSSIVNPF